MTSLNPKIAVVGFGAAAVGFTNVLRHHHLFVDAPADFHPQFKIYEGSPDLGGKMAPKNMGAQFLDAECFYPMDRIVQSLDLRLLPPREDYDNTPYVMKDTTVMSAEEFLAAVQKLRLLARETLGRQSWISLDRRGGVGFLNELQRASKLTKRELEALTCRLKLEEGTTRISALSLAINLAKGITPVKRLEVDGGLYRIAEQESRALLETGAEISLGLRVRRLEVFNAGVRLFIEGSDHPAVFDYALVAISPEQYDTLSITGSSFPHPLLSQLKPARITKSNLWIRRKGRHRVHEIATQKYAIWETTFRDDSRTLRGATFFHGWEGQRALTEEQMRVAAGISSRSKVWVESRTWDGRSHHKDLPIAYTTMPLREQGWPVVEAIHRYFLKGGFSGQRLLFANHVLGAGCYTRDAALAGEWAALWLLNSLGMSIEKAFKNRPHSPAIDFFGVDFPKP